MVWYLLQKSIFGINVTSLPKVSVKQTSLFITFIDEWFWMQHGSKMDEKCCFQTKLSRLYRRVILCVCVWSVHHCLDTHILTNTYCALPTPFPIPHTHTGNGVRKRLWCIWAALVCGQMDQPAYSCSLLLDTKNSQGSESPLGVQHYEQQCWILVLKGT